jgi:uncharacterized protein (DUF849 family)
MPNTNVGIAVGIMWGAVLPITPENPVTMAEDTVKTAPFAALGYGKNGAPMENVSVLLLSPGGVLFL